MSGDTQMGRMARVVLAMALVPVVVVVALVLVQGATLKTPSPAPAASASLTRTVTGAVARLAGHRSARSAASGAALRAAVRSDDAALRTDRQRISALAGQRSDALTYGWVAAALLLVLGVAGHSRLRSAAGPEAERRPAGARSVPVPELPPQAQLVRDRERLVAACISAVDMAPGQGERQQLLHALAGAGVTAIEVPARTRFDPAEHKAAEAVPSPEPGLDGLVAGTERCGFLDRGRRVRWPEVIVYRGRDRGRPV